MGNLTVSLPAGGSLANVSVTTPNDAVAAVVPLGNGMFSVVANGAGSTSLVASDGSGHQLNVGVSVPSTPPIIMLSPTLLDLDLGVAGLNVSTITASEAGYAGTFTISSSNTGILTATSIPLTNQFLVTSVGRGTALLTVSDSNGHHTVIGLTVQ